MDEYPVKVGAMLFTMVDPHRGHEVAYNRWYERDHFYAGCMIGPGMLAGDRWVAPKALKDLRFPEDSQFAEPVQAGSYLAIYWMNKGQEDEWGAWASTQVWDLYKNGRGFEERSHAQTGLYQFDSSVTAPDHQVPIELALDHNYGGLGVVVVEPTEGATQAPLLEWLAAEGAQTLFAAGAADIVSSWTLKVSDNPEGASAPMALGAAGGSQDRVVQLCFLDDSLEDHWDAYQQYAKAIESRGLGRCTFAAPFLPTVVGTDTYTDVLW